MVIIGFMAFQFFDILQWQAAPVSEGKAREGAGLAVVPWQTHQVDCCFLLLYHVSDGFSIVLDNSGFESTPLFSGLRIASGRFMVV